jgi:hypothetical protein
MPIAIISTLVRLEQPLDQALQMLESGVGVSVELDDERRARLDPADPRSSGFARVLDGLGKLMRPVYLFEASRALGCDVVLSEDLSDGEDYAGVRVENPFHTGQPDRHDSESA